MKEKRGERKGGNKYRDEEERKRNERKLKHIEKKRCGKDEK